MKTFGPQMIEMTWQEVEQSVAEEYVPVWLIGATEQHGPHLPLATDTMLPLEVIRSAAERLRLLIAPPLPFGFKSKPLSGGGQGFPGTMSLDGVTLIHAVRDIVSEIARHGFKKIVVFNWHMENTNFIYEGIDLASQRGSLDGVTVMSIDNLLAAFSEGELGWLFPEGFPGWDVEHAAIMETSLMLADHPELVRTERVVDDSSEEHPFYDLIPAPETHIPKSGTLSLATHGTVEKGERLQALLVERFVAAVEKEFGTPAHVDSAGIQSGRGS